MKVAPDVQHEHIESGNYKANENRVPSSDFAKNSVICSLCVDGYFEKIYSVWEESNLNFEKPGQLAISRHSKSPPNVTLFNVSTVQLLKLDPHAEDRLAGGIVITVCCKLPDGFPTNFRCFMAVDKVADFAEMFQIASRTNNIPEFKASLEATKNQLKDRPAHLFHVDDITSPEFLKIVDDVINKTETAYYYAEISRRRKAFMWLPIFNKTDLITGSWYWVLGSLFLMITSVIVTANHPHPIVGSNDDVLTRDEFRSLYMLEFVSGLFFMWGSFALVRSTTKPRLKPLFTNYHVGSDELLGAWMFFWGTLPSIPFSVIAAVGYRKHIYTLYLIVAVVASFFTLLFVWECYPSIHDEHDVNKIRFLDFVERYCGNTCGCLKTFRGHAMTDAVAGAWFIFWCTLLGTGMFAAMTTADYSASSGVTNFINITTTIDFFLFLIGSAYYVAGSYPVDGGICESADTDPEIEAANEAKMDP